MKMPKNQILKPHCVFFSKLHIMHCSMILASYFPFNPPILTIIINWLKFNHPFKSPPPFLQWNFSSNLMISFFSSSSSSFQYTKPYVMNPLRRSNDNASLFNPLSRHKKASSVLLQLFTYKLYSVCMDLIFFLYDFPFVLFAWRLTLLL